MHFAKAAGVLDAILPPNIDAARIPLREKPTAMPLLANVLVRLHYGTYSKSTKREGCSTYSSWKSQLREMKWCKN